MLRNSNDYSFNFSAPLIKILAKIITKKSIAIVRHQSFFDSAEAVIMDFFEEKVVLKFCRKFTDVYLFPEDYISFSFVAGEKVHIIDCEILDVKLDDYVEVTVKPKFMESRMNLRCYERFMLYPPLLASIENSNLTTDNVNALVRNISLNGLKFNSIDNFQVNDIVSATVILDNFNKFKCECKVLKKNQLDSLYVYRASIFDISSLDNERLNILIDDLKKARLG